MIRPAETADASRLAEIIIFTKRMTYRPLYRDDRIAFQELQVLDLALTYRDTPGALDTIYVYDDGIVKGLIRFSRIPDSTTLELNELYIDPFFQNQRIGSRLMEFFLSCARQQHAGKAVLWVLEGNEKAIQFYGRYGFQNTHEKKLRPHSSIYLIKYEKEL